ncbi:MAG TPA: Tat pathway signal protein [Janthinobacterium sp.]|nr:Tat pathway signal protein [Janthinobacterium sp.]
MAEASAATASDYKAIVCVFLYGGNDYANTVIPYDNTNYNAYYKLRPTLAYSQASLVNSVLTPTAAPLDAAGFARQYALAPELAPLLPLFNTGKMGVLLNVGTLVQATSKLQYTNKSVPLPPKLFSHNDQQSVWQASSPEGAASGWGGRMGDLFESGNGNATFTCVNVSGNAVFLSGKTAVQYQVSPGGSVPFSALQHPLFGSAACSTALQTLISQPRAHLLENEYTRVTKRSIDANSALTSALAGAGDIATPFPAANPLGEQLKLVARMIASAGAVGAKRQVFFVSMGGFDTHDGLVKVHPGLLKSVADAVAAFYAATVELGVADKVTTFTASDFGRTLSGNNDGSDHGWGSMHFMVGGAVKGQRFYGVPPAVASNGPDDVGQGRLLPTTSVDQYAATLGKWMGASDSNLLSLLPNLVNYNVGARNLGFL